MGFTLSLVAHDDTYYMNLIVKMVCLVTTSNRNTNLGMKYDIYFGALPCWLFELNIMTRLSTKSSGMISRLRALYGKNIFIYGKSCFGNKLSNSLRNAFQWRTSLLRNSHVLRGAGYPMPPWRTHGLMKLEDHGYVAVLALGIGGLVDLTPDLKFIWN